MSLLKPIVAGVLAVDAAAPAVEFRGTWLTWGDIRAAMRAADAILTQAGLQAGARIGVVLRNRPELMAVMAELFCSDRCMVTLNPFLPDDQLAADLIKTAVPALIATDYDWSRQSLRRAAAETGALGVRLTGDATAPVEMILPPDPSRQASFRLQAPGIALEMLTSGTTGAPKRIPLKAATFERSLLDAVLYESGRKPDDAPRLRSGVQILTAPFAHIAGVQAVMNCLLAGRQSCLLEKFDAEMFRQAVVRHRPKVAASTPTGVRMIMDANIPRADFASLIAFRTGAAALDPELADAFYERYGVPILQNYGATEFGTVAGWTPNDFRTFFKAKRGSVGRINRGVQARVVSPENGAVLGPGAIGLLELQAAHIGDGSSWVRTSDLATLDEDLFLWIKGRADGAIIRGGFKIQPEDVARALEQHPDVAEAVVVGVPDSRLGETPVAAYTLKADVKAPCEDALREFLRGKLLAYQIPVRFLAVETLPRTPSMKVSLVAVRELFQAQSANG